MFSNEEKEIGRFSVMLWGGLILVLLVGSGIAFIASRTVRTVDNAFIHYEDFQEIYNSCKAGNCVPSSRWTKKTRCLIRSARPRRSPDSRTI